MKDYLYTSKSDVWGFGVSLFTRHNNSVSVMIDFPPVVDLDVDLPPGVDVGVGHPGQLTLSRGHAREVRISFIKDQGSTNRATEVKIFMEHSKISFTKKNMVHKSALYGLLLAADSVTR